jgi:phosphoribosylformylglycinamidine cyclo-ligase
MGIGFCLVVPKEAEQTALDVCHLNNHQAWVIGEVLKTPPGEHSALQGLPS